jgi:DNA repair exonuclease
MKIIHCADLHLDSKMSAHLSEEKATERRYEILATFEKMVSYAIQNDIQAIMIAGDMFDTAKNKLKRIKNRVLSLIEKSSEIDFLYLRGNHDNDDFFQNLEYIPNNLKLFSSQWTAYTYNDIVITGLEFNSDITSSSNIYSNLVLNEHNFNIVLLHGQVSLYGDNKREEIINLSKLQNKSIDYLARVFDS